MILQKFRININDPANGVFLPGNLATQNINGEAVHSKLHTDKYVTAVNVALKNATTREEAIDILRGIGRALQAGGYP